VIHRGKKDEPSVQHAVLRRSSGYPMPRDRCYMRHPCIPVVDFQAAKLSACTNDRRGTTKSQSCDAVFLTSGQQIKTLPQTVESGPLMSRVIQPYAHLQAMQEVHPHLVGRVRTALATPSARLTTRTEPNSAFKRSANGRPPGPGCGVQHSPQPGPGALPLSPA